MKNNIVKFAHLGIFFTLFFLSACDKAFPPSPYTCESQPEQYKNVEEQEALLFVLWAKENADLLSEQKEIIARVQSIYKQPFKVWLRDDAIQNFTLSDKKRVFNGDISTVISMVISVHETDIDKLMQIKELLSSYGEHVAAYATQQSVPRAYVQNWKSGEQTPALISMSFFQKPAGMNKEAFKQYWFCAHTPFALDIHPLWHYERNAVEQTITQNSPNYDGIVPLYLKNDEDIGFTKFFGANGGNPLFNALRIQSDVKKFINLNLIETIAMREFVIDSGEIK